MFETGTVFYLVIGICFIGAVISNLIFWMLNAYFDHIQIDENHLPPMAKAVQNFLIGILLFALIIGGPYIWIRTFIGSHDITEKDAS
jgi:hypothetical protein